MLVRQSKDKIVKIKWIIVFTKIEGWKYYYKKSSKLIIFDDTHDKKVERKDHGRGNRWVVCEREDKVWNEMTWIKGEALCFITRSSSKAYVLSIHTIAFQFPIAKVALI